MKTKTRSNVVYLSMAALILTAALAAPAAAQKQVFFTGTFTGSDAVKDTTITTSGEGTGTHLDKFTLSQTLTVNSPTGGPGTAQ